MNGTTARTEPFHRPRRTPDCGSLWLLSRYAMGELPVHLAASVRAHRAVCPVCNAQLEIMEADQHAVAAEALPPAILAAAATARRASSSGRARTSRRWSAPGWALGALPLALSLAVVLLWQRGPERTWIRAKGSIPVLGAVLRDGQVIAPEIDLEDAQLRTGDQVRIKVPAGAGAGILLQGWEGAGWRDYFEGVLPRDRWLPLGVEITPESETRLRVIVCSSESELASLPRSIRLGASTGDPERANGCRERELVLAVIPRSGGIEWIAPDPGGE